MFSIFKTRSESAESGETQTDDRDLIALINEARTTDEVRNITTMARLRHSKH